MSRTHNVTSLYVTLCAFHPLIHFKGLHESYNLCFFGPCGQFSESSEQHVNHVCFSLNLYFSLPEDDEPLYAYDLRPGPSLRGFLQFESHQLYPWSHLNQVIDTLLHNETSFISPNCLCFVTIFKSLSTFLTGPITHSPTHHKPVTANTLQTPVSVSRSSAVTFLTHAPSAPHIQIKTALSSSCAFLSCTGLQLLRWKREADYWEMSKRCLQREQQLTQDGGRLGGGGLYSEC